MNVWSSRKVNKTLMQDIERAQADMRVAEDKQKDCSVDLTKKDSTIRVTAIMREFILGISARKTTLHTYWSK